MGDLSNVLNVASIPVITIIAYFVGAVFKSVVKTDVVNKFIPVIVMGTGLILGIACFYIAPELIAASDVFTAAAIGIVSGGAATAIDQATKQLSGIYNNKDNEEDLK